MKGDEIALRNQAIVDALRRGHNVYAVAETAELSAATVRVIAMGAGLTLTANQRARPPEPTSGRAATRRTRLPEASSATEKERNHQRFLTHLAVMDRRNQQVAEAIGDPTRLVESVLAEFGISESVLLTIGWDKGVWQGPRRPRGQDREARDVAIGQALTASLAAGDTADDACWHVLRVFGVSTAHARSVARRQRVGLFSAGREKDKSALTRTGRRRRHRARDQAILEALAEGSATTEELAAKYQLKVGTIRVIARAGGVRVPAAHRRGSRHVERDAAIVSRILAGETMRAVGEEFGLTHQRVQQIFNRGSDAAWGELAVVRRQRRESGKVAAAHELISADTERTLTWRDIAARSGLPTKAVQRLLGPMESARRYPVAEPARFALRPAIVEMRRVWLLERPEVLSGSAFDAQRRPSIVSSQSIAKRVGSWTRACELAGVPAHPGHGKYQRTWTPAHALNWVALFLTETDSLTMDTYERWAKAHDGAPTHSAIQWLLDSWGRALRQAAGVVDSGTWSDPRDATDQHGEQGRPKTPS